MTTAQSRGSRSGVAAVPISARRAALVLGCLEIFAPISMDLYMPTLPQLARDLGTSDSLAQATMSACMVGLGAGQLLAGPVSDRIGRRRPMLMGIVAFIACSVLCAVAPTIHLLLVARFLQGVAGSAGIVVTFAVARDMFSGVDLAKLLSLLALVSGLAPILAPVAGGQLAAVMGWRGIFGVLAAIGCAQLLLAALALPESLDPHRRHRGNLRDALGQAGHVLGDKVFVALLSVGALGGIAFFTYLASISFVVQDEMGMTPVAFSVIFAVNSVMLVLGSQINRLALRRAGLRHMYAIGLSCSASAALVVLVTVLAGGPALLVLGVLALMLCCFGMNQPNGAALTLTRHGERAGTASALFGTCNFVLGPLVAPLVSLGGASSTTMALTVACAATGAALLAWLVVIPMLKADERAGDGGARSDH